MKRITRWLVLGACAAVAAIGCAPYTATADDCSPDADDRAGKANEGQATVTRPDVTRPIVAPLFTEGMEVVIQPVPGKLEALGLKVEQLQRLRYQRFTNGDWQVEVDGKTIDLTRVARLTVRPIHAPPFTVVLPDGRKVVVTPNAQRICAYLVTGEWFEECVRSALADSPVKEPAWVTVLSGIHVPGGQVPNKWGPDHVHRSLGEPLERFATVEVRK
jgi:hypothetical protein